MSAHIAQFQRNKNFHSCIETSYPDDFSEWKITVLFYQAVHLIHGLSDHKSVYIGSSHETVGKNIDPNNNTAAMPIDGIAHTCYKKLKRASRNARYDGINVPLATYERIMRDEHTRCVGYLQQFKKYIAEQGVQL